MIASSSALAILTGSPTGDSGVLRFDRRLDDEVITVIVNFSDKTLPWPTDLTDVTVLVSNAAGNKGNAMALGPNEAVLVQIRSK
jgi:hypothetical protein